MVIGYHDGSRSLQDQFDTRALADRIDELLVPETISEHDRAFIEARDMFFLATADAEGRPTCSYKGGEPGFVRVLDEQTLAFPNYDGNGMYLSIGNVLVQPGRGAAVHRLRTAATGCGSRARRPSTPTIRCALTTRRPSSSFASVRGPSSRTVRATSTATSWCSARGSCHE